METAFHDVGQARRFLAAAIAWPDGPIAGVFNVVTRALPAKDAKDQRVFWNHLGVSNLDDAIRAIEHQIKKRGATDIYGWMALGSTNAEPISPRPGSWYKGNRLAENAIWFKSIFLDVDGGPTKTYKTVEDARAAFDQFLIDANLPKPNLIVSSGHGFHCHWTVTEPIPPATWQNLSGRLIGAVQAHNLAVDAEVTLDRARILRIPGTWNNKDPDHPVKVELIRFEDAFFLEALERRLAPYPPVSVVTKSGAKATGPAGSENLAYKGPLKDDSEQLAEGAELNRLPIDIEAVALECPMIADALDTAGAAHANPLWHQLVHMSTFCINGPEVVHELSSGHPTYSEEETDAQYARAVKTRELRDPGWTSCRKFHSVGSTFCESCPHFAEDKSPFNFFTPESNTEIPIPTDLLEMLSGGKTELWLPDEYKTNRDKLICKLVQGEDDSQPPELKPISDSKILHGWLTDSPKELHFSYVALGNSGAYLPGTARIELRTLADPKQTRAGLASQGFIIKQNQQKLWEGFPMSWADKLKQAQEGVYYDKASFGWVTYGNQIIGFAYDGITWAKTPRPAPAIEALSSDYTPKGALEPWKAATKLVTGRGMPELEILLAIGFASPLVGLLTDTARGIQIFAWSRDSGAGKTTALSLAASVWGDPMLTMQQADDTWNSINKRMGDLRNLPLIWDEFKTATDTDNFINMIFRASGGKSKSRLSSDIGYRAVRSWATILACASNGPMLDRIHREVARTNAGVLRIFEYEIGSSAKTSTGMVESELAAELLKGVQLNYGHAGRIYAKWLGENFEAIRDDLSQFRAELEKGLEHPTQERFWSAAITVLVKGAQYARQLGLVDFHPKEMLAFCQKLVSHMRTDASRTILDPTTNTNDLKELFNAFRGDLAQRETIKFEQIHTGPGRPTGFKYDPIGYIPNNIQTFSISESDKDELIRFTYRSLFDWLRTRKMRQDPFGHYSAAEVIEALTRMLGAVVKPQGRLAPGFTRDPGITRIVEISTLTNPDLKSSFK